MSREILFRGKSLSNGEWEYGFYTQGSFIDPNTGKETVRHIIDNGLLHDIAPDTVGQFTGLVDKNGVKIFEGDIVKCETFVYKVAYDNKRIASFFLRRDVDMYRHYFGEAMDSDDCDVIGNIYDNPELLSTK